jgi:hypothetical protein
MDANCVYGKLLMGELKQRPQQVVFIDLSLWIE